MRNRIQSFFLISALLLPTFVALGKKVEQPPKFELKWLIAHDPNDKDVVGGLEKMAKQISEKSKGQLTLRIEKSSKEFNSLYFYSDNALKKVRQGDFDLAQVPTSVFSAANPELETLDLPFLFDSYSHAERILDGPVGSRILTQISKKDSAIHPLAFAYSGGFLMFLAIQPTQDLNGLRGKKVVRARSEGSHQKILSVTNSIFSGMGLEPIDEPDRSNEIGVIEITFKELLAEKLHKAMPKGTVFETSHRLYTTLMVANKKSLEKLPPNLRELFESEVKEMARQERSAYIDANARAKDELKKINYKIHSLSKEEEKSIHENLKSVENKNSKVIDSQLLQDIRNATK